ncbi:glutamyl-tRNA synthetase [Coniochaeta ligniaria NRRL 30616]|uniref:glutamate--tRNA ligase n=1 Tax=Coniochaeta ligniaria NRRL 30616 TaxID=1408157 RepID=A0A1J7JEX7_9PEZI|nr:glutamyl-tRNA synthetase [Coniochaeta ligniaria NRRL 30616]
MAIGTEVDVQNEQAESLRQSLQGLNSHLTLRTYISGDYHVSVADIAVWATIRGNPNALSLLKSKTSYYTNVGRWYSFMDASNPWFADVLASLTAADTTKRALAKSAGSAAGASYHVLDSIQVDGPMVTRFPPEPSGYLHIGHAKAALLNDYVAHQKPGGKLICRFDDTNPSNESKHFQKAITHDLAMIGVIPDKESHSSDYFQKLYDYALRLINLGKAFADDSELGKGDETRKNRLPSKHRDMTVDETLLRFQEMATGSDEGGRWCLRARIAYDSPNGTLRDPVIYRCNDTPHHRTGTDWNIYPTYDFCAPVLDAIEGVTLALRDNTYRDRNAQYAWIQAALGLRRVPIQDFSRLNFVRTVLSKRKLARIVDQGKVRGWSDPRMPTIRGIIRRGCTVPALRQFILDQGPSRNVLNLQWGTFWATNRKLIDPVAPRHTAIAAADAVHCDVVGGDCTQVLDVPKYVKNPSLGSRRIKTHKTIIIEQVDAQSLHVGQEITLMHWGNAIVREISTSTSRRCIDADDGTTLGGNDKSTAPNRLVKRLVLDLNTGSCDFRNTKKITWLAAVNGNMVPVKLMTFDHLISKDKLEPSDELEDWLTPVTESTTYALADDCNIADLAQGDVVQLERKGYYRLDDLSRFPMVFIKIP